MSGTIQLAVPTKLQDYRIPLVLVLCLGDRRTNKAMFMASISVAEIQELVRQLPEEKLPAAYRLLRELTRQETNASPQVAFMSLPPSERRRLLTEQAGQMIDYYEQTTVERQVWQNGDLQDEY